MKNLIYVALDLELYTAKEEAPTEEIIEVGITLAAPTWQKDDWIKKSWLIDPGKPLSEFIIGLTGITQEEMDRNHVSVQQCVHELSDLLASYPRENMHPNPVVWGGNDAQEFIELVKANKLPFPYFGHRSIDVKTVASFIRLAKDQSKPLGLSKAMGQFKLPFEGRAHRAHIDAYNTLRFWFELLHRQACLEDSLKNLQTLRT